MFKKNFGKVMGMVFAAGAALSTLSASAAGDVRGVAMAVSHSNSGAAFPTIVFLLFASAAVVIGVRLRVWFIEEVDNEIADARRRAIEQRNRMQKELERKIELQALAVEARIREAARMDEQSVERAVHKQEVCEQERIERELLEQRLLEQRILEAQMREQQILVEQQRQVQQQMLDEQQRQAMEFSMKSVTPIEQGGFVDTTFSAGGTFGF